MAFQKFRYQDGITGVFKNAAEWTLDYYRDYPDSAEQNPSNQKDLQRGAVIRGGYAGAPAAQCRCSMRGEGHGAIARAQNMGFRIVINL